MKKMLVVALIAFLSGCAYDKGRRFSDEQTITLCAYVDDLREAAVRRPTAEEQEFFSDVPELYPSMTTHFVSRDFQVVYLDAQCVSFRADMEDYHGGCGNHSSVAVGTISRKTGSVLCVADFVPKAKWPILKKMLYEGAVQKLGGKENLQGEVDVIENFYYDKSGLHFIYNPYEIACGAAGAIEVVIDLKKL